VISLVNKNRSSVDTEKERDAVNYLKVFLISYAKNSMTVIKVLVRCCGRF